MYVQDKQTVQLDDVKEQCVRIIGMLGGSINHALVSRTDPTHLEKLAVAWDSHKHLRFDVPFQDVKPTIYFGKSLPAVHLSLPFISISHRQLFIPTTLTLLLAVYCLFAYCGI